MILCCPKRVIGGGVNSGFGRYGHNNIPDWDNEGGWKDKNDPPLPLTDPSV